MAQRETHQVQQVDCDADSMPSVGRARERFVNGAAPSLRQPRMLVFSEESLDVEHRSIKAVHWNFPFEGERCPPAVKVMRLEVDSYSVIDLGGRLLLTHVLRHSQSGIRWRNGAGDAHTLDAGDTFVAGGPRSALVQLAPTGHDGACECVCVFLGGSLSAEAAGMIGAHDGPFCNTTASSARVMIGSHFEPVADWQTAARVRLMDIDIAPFADLELPVSAECWALALLTSGSLKVNGMLVERLCAITFQGHESVARLTAHTGASVLWFDIPYGVTPGRPEHITQCQITDVVTG